MEALTQRMRCDQRLELAGERAVAAEGKLGLDPVLHGDQAAFLEPHHLALAASRQRNVGQGRSPPQLQGLPEQPHSMGRVGGQRGSALGGQPLKARKIELVGAHLDQVAGRAGPEDLPGRPLRPGGPDPL
jgi:hypothetical protein